MTTPTATLDQADRAMSAHQLAALPVSPAVSDAVLTAHRHQLERQRSTQRAAQPLRGTVRFSASLGGFQFIPADAASFDRLMEDALDGLTLECRASVHL